jgi:uncharacterized protein YcfJ|tara:strand:- start:647 stop:1195 length:549 start_codon:yes stop_codon:yes gene_type:complete
MKRSMIAAGVLTAALTVFNIGTAFAQQTYTIQGTVLGSEAITAQQTKQIPTQTCQMVQVPVYGSNNQGNGGTLGLNNMFDLGGAIIGGVIGNNVTKNVDNGGAVGAVIGGLVGSQMQQKNNQQVVGYRQEQRCATSYTTQSEEVVVGYNVAFEANGFQGVTKRATPLNAGAPITVQITLTAK